MSVHWQTDISALIGVWLAFGIYGLASRWRRKRKAKR